MRKLIPVLISITFLAGCSHLKSIHQTKESDSSSESNGNAPALPSGRGTAAEAKAMVLKAVDHYVAVGRTKALEDFTAMRSPFGDRDLYVICIGSNNKITANGGFAQFVGQPAEVLKDADGRSLGRAMWDAASGSGEGTVEYKWINPVSNLTERKIGFFKKVGEDVCGVSYFNPE